MAFLCIVCFTPAKAVKGTLNKLTPEKFERLLQQLVDVVTSAEILHTTISLVFESAVAQPTFVAMYADLCDRLSKVGCQHHIASPAIARTPATKRAAEPHSNEPLRNPCFNSSSTTAWLHACTRAFASLMLSKFQIAQASRSIPACHSFKRLRHLSCCNWRRSSIVLYMLSRLPFWCLCCSNCQSFRRQRGNGGLCHFVACS